jgi:LmbE family N-acetylglucosaminyl deacetylase
MSRRSQAAALAPVLLLVLLAGPLAAQRELAGEARIRLALDRLNVLGSVLMIAAHPDDENTALLAYFARGRKLRTAYLSLTRGEGGQNLVGSEQGDLLGVLRTQELLAARKIDGAEQYFTRAIDFGYSKSADETLAKWGREEILGDIVWVIRRLRPDVVILRFSGTARDGHGQHQASAILGKEAFAAAADPKRFPDQLREARPWQPRRLFWNVFSFRGGRFTDSDDLPGRIDLDAGEYNPVLGFSYAEIAGMSRSMHRSQGFGAPETRGPVPNSLLLLAGEPAGRDPFDGIDTSWNRVLGGAPAGELLRQAAQTFRPEQPEATVPLLLQARAVIRRLDDPWAAFKLEELDETIALLAGLWLDATADRYYLVPGTPVKIETVALNRSRYPLELSAVEIGGAAESAEAAPLAYNQPVRRSFTWTPPRDRPYTHPFWLRRPKHDESRYELEDMSQVGRADTEPVLWAHFRLKAGAEQIVLRRPVEYRYVDRVRGELTRPLAVVPPVAVALAREAIVVAEAQPRTLAVELAAHAAPEAGEVRLELPAGWSASPPRQPFRLDAPGEQATIRFRLIPPAEPSRQSVAAEVFDTREEMRSAFGKLDLSQYGVLPVLVVMQNDSSKALRLDGVRFEYIRPDRRRLQAVPAGEVQYLYGVKKPQTVPAPRYPLPGLGGKSKNPLAAWEIEGRAFAAKMLPPGDAASGFVYFQTANHRGAVLYVTGVVEAATGQELFYFEIPLD